MGLGELFHCADSDLRITCANGNSVIFKGLDDGKAEIRHLPQGELTEVWIEEASEVSEEEFNQLDIRLRGGGPQADGAHLQPCVRAALAEAAVLLTRRIPGRGR